MGTSSTSVHRCVYKISPRVPVPNHALVPNPAHSKIPPSTSKSSKWSSSFKFLQHNTVRISFLLMRATCSAHLILLDLIALIISGTNRKVTVSKGRCAARI
jgi:hypothetical protein